MRLLTPLAAALLLTPAASMAASNIPPVLIAPADGDYPYADLLNGLGTTAAVTVQGRLVLEDDGPVDIHQTKPLKVSTQEELKGATVTLWLIPVEGPPFAWTQATSDDEGYISHRASLPPGTRPGTYTAAAVYQGQRIGSARLRLLADEHAGFVVRSDVDQTYLDTDFHGFRAQLGLINQTGSEKQNLPAMEAVYLSLRAGADGNADRPLTFLSGSPRFFKRTLTSHMALDAVQHDGLVLKPMKDVALDELISGRIGQIVPALEEQIGYKMSALLSLRLEIPPGTPEVLMGDDTEADFVVYNLYHRFTSGALSVDALMTQLEAAPLSVSAQWLPGIRRDAEAVQTYLKGQPPPVRAIYINHTEVTSDRFKVDEWIVPGLTRYHQGAWPLVLDLYEDGWVSEAAVGEVRQRLLTLGLSDDDLAKAVKDGVERGFLNP